MVDIVRIKRRASGGAGAPASLLNAELAYNEVTDVLYYGKGNSGGVATSIIAVGGPGAFAVGSFLPLTAGTGFPVTGPLYVQAVTPGLRVEPPAGSPASQSTIQLYRPGGGVDRKTWEFLSQSDDNFCLRIVNDAYSAAGAAFTVWRNAGFAGVAGTYFAGAIMAGTVRGRSVNASGQADTVGSVCLVSGTSAAPGYIEWYRPDATTRICFLGYSDAGTTNLNLTLEGGAGFYIRNGIVNVIGSDMFRLTVAANSPCRVFTSNSQRSWSFGVFGTDWAMSDETAGDYGILTVGADKWTRVRGLDAGAGAVKGGDFTCNRLNIYGGSFYDGYGNGWLYFNGSLRVADFISNGNVNVPNGSIYFSGCRMWNNGGWTYFDQPVDCAYLNARGNITSTSGAITSNGGNSGLQCIQRDNFGRMWMMYATADIFRIWESNYGDRFTVDITGHIGTYGYIRPTQNNNFYCGVDAWGLNWYNVCSYNFTNTSDVKLKTDIEALPDCLDVVKALSPKQFRWIDGPERWRRNWGFVAQEVGAAMDAAGYDFSGGYRIAIDDRPGPTEGEEHHGLVYSSLVAVLWKAVQELADEVRALRMRNAEGD